MQNDPGVPSAPASRGFASIVTLVSDVSRELLMVKGQLPGPLEPPQPKAPPAPQHATPPSAPQPARSTPQRAPAKPRSVPQSVPQSLYAISAARQKVNSPAVMLMVCAGLGILMDLAGLFSFSAAGSAQEGGRLFIFLNLIRLAASGFIFFGALKMKTLESRGLAMAASIVAIIPIFTSCFVAIPAGIWALVVLNKADVKAAFR